MSWGTDWRTLSLPDRIFTELQHLASFWRMSPENALSLLLRAARYDLWPEGDVGHDPAAFEAWALAVIERDPAVTPPLPSVRVSLRELGIDSEGNPRAEEA